MRNELHLPVEIIGGTALFSRDNQKVEEKTNIKRKKKRGAVETDQREALRLFLVPWEIAY